MSDKEWTLGDLPEDDQARLAAGLADIVAREREHSSVSGNTFRRVTAISRQQFARGERSQEDFVRRVVDELPRENLAEIVGEWLTMNDPWGGRTPRRLTRV